MDSAYADLKEVDPNIYNERDGPWVRNTFNALRRDFTILMTRFEASGQQTPDAEIFDFTSGLANAKGLRLMFELYDGTMLMDYANRSLVTY